MRRFVAGVAALAIGFTSIPVSAQSKHPNQQVDHNPGIIPPHARPYGKTYGEWSAEWWRWALRLPITDHPLLDTTGVDAAAGQTGPVWFLCGTLTLLMFNGHMVGVADRTISVPTGKALFFPILNTEDDNAGMPFPETVDQLRAVVRGNMDGATNMTCTIDGVPVKGLGNVLTTPYRVASPVFDFWMPETDNLYQWYGLDFSGYSYPAVAEGVYLMLNPLPPGVHTIHFGGDVIGADGNIVFSLDINYRVLVNVHPAKVGPRPIAIAR